MRLGLPEVLVIVGVFAFIVVSVAITIVFFRWMASRDRSSSLVASKLCRHCGQSVPDIGAYCAFCGHANP